MLHLSSPKADSGVADEMVAPMLMCRSHHLTSQAGWDRCKLTLFLDMNIVHIGVKEL